MYNREIIIEKLKEYYKNPEGFYSTSGSSREVFLFEDYAVKIPLSINYRYPSLLVEKDVSKIDLGLFELNKEDRTQLLNYLDSLDLSNEEVLRTLNGINQNLYEYATWLSASFELAQFLAPILDFFFFQELPIIVMPKAIVFEDFLCDLDREEVAQSVYDEEVEKFYDFEEDLKLVSLDLSCDFDTENCGLINGELKMIDYGLGSNSNFILL
jgi:hypothetical protein